MLQRHKQSHLSRRVGLDIGSHTIKAVEVAQRDQELVVSSAGACPITGAKEPTETPEVGVVASAIKSLWASARFKSSNVVLALPADRVHVKWLNLEATSREDLDLTARAAAVRGAPFPADDAVVDFRVLSSRGTPARNVYFTMLVAVSGSDVDRLLAIAECAGLTPIAVDVTSTAAMRILDTQRRGASNLWRGQPLAHITMGARNTTMTVLRAGELEFARTVPVGGNDFTAAVAESRGVSFGEAERTKTSPGARFVSGGALVVPTPEGEARVECENVVGRLAREIQRSLRFFRSQFAEGSYLGMIGDISMSGGGTLLKGLDVCLQEHGLEVSGIINPFAGLSVDTEGCGVQHISDSATQYAAAVGLAIADYWTAASDAPVTEQAA